MRWAFVIALVTGCGRIGFDAIDYRGAVLADQPVGYWRLGDSGATARDEVGMHAGTYTGNCKHGAGGAIAGDPDTAAVFDGASCYISIADAFNFAGAQPFTIEAWASLEPGGGNGFQHVFTRMSRDAANAPVDGYALVDNGQGIFVERQAGGAGIGTNPKLHPIGSYAHYVGVFDGAELRMYLDAALVDTANDGTALPAFAFTALIGVGSVSLSYAWLHGTLDEVALYDHALTPERIAFHHDIGVGAM